MPAHLRRQKHSSVVARLPSSRLPLGTPQVPSRSQTTSRATNRSTSGGSHITAPSDCAIGNVENDYLDMTNSTHPAMSTAEAKLQRQNERIQLAEAALANPPQLDRSRPQSRAKTKISKTSDDPLYSGRSRATSISDGGVAVETRLYSYRSEGSRPPRPYKGTSRDESNTAAAAAVGMERQDSVVDDAGFQTYTGRRNGRRSELGAYEDKSEIKQTTVEATVDQREILAVFANPLPGLEFLAGQAGWRDGQVQFIQHPNGDVSAHMWSLRSYQWDNIGHFSNIRKKIEGQLAGDHLKGETTFQKLQQNSLAYFRTIAKQREAATTGLEFGQAEVRQLLPEPAQCKDSATSGKKLKASTPVFPQSAQPLQLADPGEPKNKPSPQPRMNRPHIGPADGRSFYAVPQGSRFVEDDASASLSPRQVRGVEDPFTANAFVPTFGRLGPEYNGGTVAGPARKSSSMRPPAPIDPRFPGHGLYHQIPLPAVPDVRMPCKPLPASRISSSENIGRTFGSSFLPHSNMPTYLPARVAGTGPESDRRHLSVASIESSHGNLVTPLQAREAMRENLFKISDHAVKRSLSRENLQNLSATEREQSQSRQRTVLHDPFQNDSKTGCGGCTSPSVSRRTESEDCSPGIPLASQNSLYRNTGMPLRWDDTQSTKNAPSPIESHMTNSVPDYVDVNCGAPLNQMHFGSYGCYPDRSTSSSTETSSTQPIVSSERQLNDWWTSGSKFARQEDLYQRIQALSKPNTSNEDVMGRTSTVANPRRPLVARPVTTTSDDILTRVLIPVCENLASYTEDAPRKRRNYWSPRWRQPPEWCIDRSPSGNNSFYDDVGSLPAQTGVIQNVYSMQGDMRPRDVAVPVSLERRLRDTQH